MADVNLIAVNLVTLHPEGGKRRVISPGGSFSVDPRTARQLVRAGAAQSPRAAVQAAREQPAGDENAIRRIATPANNNPSADSRNAPEPIAPVAQSAAAQAAADAEREAAASRARDNANTTRAAPVGAKVEDDGEL